MDLEALYLVGGVIATFSALLFIIFSLFRNKSYEEVIAEQKQQTNALFSNQQKPKLKDKKQKKANKKLKEKKPNNVKEVEEKEELLVVDTPDVKDPGHKPHHNHVEFKETVEEDEIKPEPTKVPKQASKNVIKPILLNKEAVKKVQENKNEPVINHFEKLHPKDELELHGSQMQIEEVFKKKEKLKLESDVPKNKKTLKHQVNEGISKTVEVEKKEPSPVIVENGPAAPIPTGQINQTNGLPPVSAKDKKKKKGELNILTKSADDKQGVSLADLMPLVRKAEMSRVEVQILIDMLLNKQQDAPIVDDWSEGKSDPVQRLKKQLAEREKQVVELQESVTASQNKLRAIRSEQNADRSILLQKIREHEQRSLKYEQELQALTVKYDKSNEEKVRMRQILEELTLKIQQSKDANLTITQLQHHAQTQQEEIDIKNGNIQTLQQQVTTLLCQEDELKKSNAGLISELQRAAEEIRRLEHGKSQEIQNLKKFKDESDRNQENLLKEIKSIKMEIKKLEDEKLIVAKDSTQLKDENISLNKLISALNDEKSKLIEEKKSLQVIKTNGSIENTKHEMEINKLTSELQLFKAQQQQDKKLYEDKLQLLQKEIEEEKNKNNELRQKNWKVMEALQTAETRIKTSPNKSSKHSDIVIVSKLEEEKSHKVFLQKLFPDIKLDTNSSEEDIAQAISKHIQTTHITPNKNSNSDITKLRSQVSDYKKIIDETEGMLSGLQKHIEEEEIRWRRELQLKEDYIQKLLKRTQVDYNDVATNGEVGN